MFLGTGFILFILPSWCFVENLLNLLYSLKTNSLWVVVKAYTKITGKSVILKPYMPHFLFNNNTFINYFFMILYVKPNLNSYKVLNAVLSRPPQKIFTLENICTFIFMRSLSIITGVPILWFNYYGRIVGVLELWLDGYKITTKTFYNIDYGVYLKLSKIIINV